MAGPFDFTGQNIEDSYQRVLQTDGTLIYDGTGSAFTLPSTFPFTGSALITGSLGVTGSTSIQGTFNQGSASLASGLFSHVQGLANTASGDYSHAEGQLTKATGSYSHAEGYNTIARGLNSHAEGVGAQAIGNYSHAEGSNTQATNSGSHAEGSNTISSGASSHAEGNTTTATGDYSHAEGASTIAIGIASHAEGKSTQAIGEYSHAEGVGAQAIGNYSHTEGSGTQAIGEYSHAEGSGTQAIGEYSHAEGSGAKAIGGGSHAEGFKTTSSGSYSHAEGNSTQTTGSYSHAEGDTTKAIGIASHAEGQNTIASGNYSHTEGDSTQATGKNSHAEGNNTQAIGDNSHAEGGSTQAIGEASHAEGNTTISSGSYSHAEGISTQAIGDYSHAEGASTITLGQYSHAEGESTKTGITTAYSSSISSGIITLSSTYSDVSGEFATDNRLLLYDTLFDGIYGTTTFIISQSYFSSPNTIVELVDTSVTTTTAYVGNLTYGIGNWIGDQTIPGDYSHAEGISTQAIGFYSHAEGRATNAIGEASHAEGRETQAIGSYSHAEGINTQAIGEASHAEGRETQAIGSYSHAEGQETIALGQYSHAEGYNTITSASYQHVQGQWNATSSIQSAFIVGNGTDNNNRSNLIYAAGNEVQISGSLSVSGSITGSLFGTASNALTASYLNTLNQNLTFNGNLTLNGTASISTLVVNQTQYSSGSNQLGDASNDTQTLYGSVIIPTGSLTVTGSAIINTLTVGLGGGQQTTNTAIGVNALSQNTTGTANTAVGYLALASNNTTGTSNSAFGYLALRFSAGGSNSAFGTTALYGITAGSSNSAFGRDAGYYIADGVTAATTLNTSVFIGANTKALANGQSNQIVIGQNAIGLGNNSAVLGNDSITRTALKGDISIGTTGSISSRLHIQGSGATSATTTLRVENTNASASLVVLDNGYVGINTGSAAYNLDVNGTARLSDVLSFTNLSSLTPQGTTAADRRLLIRGGEGGGVGSTSLITLTTNGNITSTSGNPVLVNISRDFTPTSGTATYTLTSITGTINQTGGANGITRGLYINPTLTSAANFRAIETTAGNVLFQSGSTPLLFVSSSGNIGINTTSSAYRLQIDANGASNSSLPLALTSVDAANRVGILFASSSISAGKQHRLLHRVNTPTVEWLLGTSAGETAIWRFLPRDDTNYGVNIISPFNGGTSYLTTGLSQSLFSLGAGSQTAQHINISSSGNVGIGTTTPSYRLDVSGSGNFTANLTVTGSTTLHNGQTTIQGAGATSATTALVVRNSTPTNIITVLNNNVVGINRTPTASLDVAGTTRLSGSFDTAASGSILTVIGSGSTQPIFTVQGSQGELFSITDSLTGSLFSVNDISGLPILEVFSDNTTLIGDYQDPALITTTKKTANTGVTTIYSLPTASYDGAWFDYTIRSGSDARVGTIMGMWSGSSVNYTETSASQFGTTSGFTFGMSISGSNMILSGSATTSGWTVKTIIRSI